MAPPRGLRRTLIVIRKAASQQAAQQEAQAQASGSGSGTWTGEQRGQERASAQMEEIKPSSTGATAGRGRGRGRERGRGRARGGRGGRGGGGGGGGVDAHRLMPHPSDAAQAESQPEAPKPLSRNARKKLRQAQVQAQREAETDTSQPARNDNQAINVVPLSRPVSTPQPSTQSQNVFPPTIIQQGLHSGQGGGRGHSRGRGRGGRGGVRITPSPKRTSKPKREIKPEDTHYVLVLEAANAAVSTLNKLGLKCAIFGSLASKLYGCSRCPKDVDILTFPHVTNPLSDAKIKDMIVAADSRFFLKLPKDPRNDYRILWYRRPSPSTSMSAFGGGGRERATADGVKWFIVESPIPLPITVMRYPGPPPHEVDEDGNIIWRYPYPQSAAEIGLGKELDLGTSNSISLPVLPFPILFLQKLQGWADNHVAYEFHKRSKQVQDAADVKSLLKIGIEMCKLTVASSHYYSMTTSGKVFHDVWNDKTWFPGDFMEVSRKRVRLFCYYFPETWELWARLGFEVVLREGEKEEELVGEWEYVKWVMRDVVEDREDFDVEEEVDHIDDVDNDVVETSHDSESEEDVGVSELDRCEEVLWFCMSLSSTLNI
ncbi:hypothetical protein BDQ17DRAFT_1429542 [Cyathus striatus]|nr:hypothetical protein BDQ17DRAFT_1429542 [Cyathus striatus]